MLNKIIETKVPVKRYLNIKFKHIAAVAAILVFMLIAFAFVEPHMTEVKETHIMSSDIPDSFNGLKAVFISDIHHGPYFSRDRVRGIIDRINNLKPDLILLGGDYLHRDLKYMKPCFEELGQLKAKYGIFAVLGNHDHWEGEGIAKDEMRKWGIQSMDNRAKWLVRNGERIKIGGVGDLYTDYQDISPTIEDAGKNDFVILLSHNPDYAEMLETDKVDLMLSGHTHGGQITLFGLWAPILPSTCGQKYRTGLVETNHTKVLVSNGIGTITPPLRLFARPQINVIYLHKANK